MSSMFGDVLGSVLSSALSGQQGAQGGLGSMLGGILGNVAGGRQAGGSLGGMLGNMLGGSHQNQPPQQSGLGGTLGLGGNASLLAVLLPMAFQLIQSQGGLSSLTSKFQNAGMGEQVKSWVGTGANHAISGEHVAQAIGVDTIAQLAQQLGLPQEQVSNGLAEVLPEIVNQITPHGNVPDNQHQLVEHGLAVLTRMLA